MKKYLLLFILFQFFILKLDAQCVYQTYFQEGFEYSTALSGIIPGTLYQGTPQTFCPRSGSRSFYANFQNGFVGEFYNKSFDACPNAQMRFSFWTKDCFGSTNNINMTIRDANGLIISGPQNVFNPPGGGWQQIVTPAFFSTTSTITISMSTVLAGGGGNDMTLDDFLFEICSDPNYFNTTNDVFVCNTIPLNLHDSLTPANLSLLGVWSGPSLLSNGSVGTFNQLNQADGLYAYTLNGITNCPDTINFVNVSSSIIFDTINESICSGQNYTFTDGTTTNTAGFYQDSLQTAQNCDSILTINLSILPPLTRNFSATFCSNQTYTLSDGTILNATGIYQDTLNTALGCDSILTLNLTFAPIITSSINAIICSNQQYTRPNGQIVNTAGTYIDTVQNAAGCDSSIAVILTVNATTSAVVNASICSNATYTLPDGQVVNTAGTYIDTIVNNNNCDSVITTNLSVLATTSSSLLDTICSNQNYVTPSGKIINAAGNYSDTISNALGCDSIISISLTVHNATVISQQPTDVIICSGTDALFYLAASGVNISIQWQENSGLGFQNIAGATNDTLTLLNVNIASNNFMYRCLVNSQCGVTNSNSAELSFADSLEVISEPNDVILCPDETTFSFELDFVAQNVTNYQWQINDGSGFQNLSNAGNILGANSNKLIVSVPYTNVDGAKFRVLYGDACGNNEISSEYLFQLKYPDAVIPSKDFEFCENDDRIIEVNYNATEYTWNDAANTTGRFFTPNETGNYVVTFRQNSSTCLAKDTIYVFIEDCLSKCKVSVPTGFTPNQDNVNDILKPIITCDLSFYEFIIVNRWGETVFKTNNVKNGWNGMYKNQFCLNGVYIWSVKYNLKGQNNIQTNKGSFTLIR